MLYEQSDGKALVVCASKQEVAFGRPSKECKPAEVIRVSTDELEVVLEHDPRIGRLLTLQLSRDGAKASAIVVRVTATTPRPQGGWLVHCKPVLPLTRSHLGTELRPCGS
jgi:hypothetical protein